METNPLYYGLPGRIRLEVLGKNHLGIVKLIKSRIIQQDARKLLEQARQVQSKVPGLQVSIICTSNICSKSVKLLEEEGIGIVVRENISL